MSSKALKPITSPGAQLVEFEKHAAGGLEGLAGAMIALGEKISDMSPDDVVLEIHSERMGDKASSRISFRAYRHRK